MELFHAYDWPGNIRELQNVVERAVILCEGETFWPQRYLTTESPMRHSNGCRYPSSDRGSTNKHRYQVFHLAQRSTKQPRDRLLGYPFNQ
jgi:DNA-binding NtrC family response regulator